MGSLMAGWDSPVHHHSPKEALQHRNISFTKGEIEAFWRSKKKTEEDHLRSLPSSPAESPMTTPRTSGKEVVFERANTFPVSAGRLQELLSSAERLEDQKESNGWWTRSYSAFLNEPPVILEEPPFVCGRGRKSRMPLHGVDSIKPGAQAY